MELPRLSYLAISRHGESEGDVRRSKQQAGELVATSKTPDQEELTDVGWTRSKAAGIWIREHILRSRGWLSFDIQRTSPSLRCVQTAEALSLGEFSSDALLVERHRGDVRGLSPSEHQARFPASYRELLTDPLHWRPPGQGSESIAGAVIQRTRELLGSLAGARSALIVTHRDTIWSFLGLLEGWEGIDTDTITNNIIIEYTSLHPTTGVDYGELSWVRWSRPEAGPPIPDSWVRLGTMASTHASR